MRPETLMDIRQAKDFTSLDLKSGYWQLPLDKDFRALKALFTPDGALYQFRVMLFGLKGAPLKPYNG